MRRAAIVVHAVWATWERLPFLDEEVEKHVHGAIAAKCRRLGCPPLAIGGMADHEIAFERVFRWQERYYATAVAPDDLPAVERYVQRQRLHHGSAQLLPDLEPPHVDP